MLVLLDVSLDHRENGLLVENSQESVCQLTPVASSQIRTMYQLSYPPSAMRVAGAGTPQADVDRPSASQLQRAVLLLHIIPPCALVRDIDCRDRNI